MNYRQNFSSDERSAAGLKEPIISIDSLCVSDGPVKGCPLTDITGEGVGDCKHGIVWLNCKATSTGNDIGQIVTGPNTTTRGKLTLTYYLGYQSSVFMYR